MSALNADSWVVQSGDQVSANVDGEVVMMSIERGSYYSLRGSGSRVWELIASARRVGDVVDELRSEFNVDAASCTEEVLAFLESLVERGLVVQASPDAGAA